VDTLPPGGHLLTSDRVFAKGWHRVEGELSAPFRWSGRHAEIHLGKLPGRWLGCRVFTNHPEVGRRPVTARFRDRASGREIGLVTLTSPDPVRLVLPVPDGETALEVAVDLTWISKLVHAGSEDARELGIGVREVAVGDEPGELPAFPAGTRRRGMLSRLRSLCRSGVRPSAGSS
jgi:hypothetical protein